MQAETGYTRTGEEIGQVHLIHQDQDSKRTQDIEVGDVPVLIVCAEYVR
jgi:hypothetical protein